jgi:ActR/RegA family two-component response regulator
MRLFRRHVFKIAAEIIIIATLTQFFAGKIIRRSLRLCTHFWKLLLILFYLSAETTVEAIVKFGVCSLLGQPANLGGLEIFF